MMKSTEIRELTTAEIVEKISNDIEALNRLEMNHAISPLDSPQTIRVARRNIARLKTILRQRN